MTNPPSPSLTPRRKVVVGAVGGAIVTLLVALDGMLGGPEIKAGAAAAAVVVVSFVLSYLVPSGDQEP